MPGPFVIAGWFVELGGQFIPAGLIARFDPHDVTCAGERQLLNSKEAVPLFRSPILTFLRVVALVTHGKYWNTIRWASSTIMLERIGAASPSLRVNSLSRSALMSFVPWGTVRTKCCGTAE